MICGSWAMAKLDGLYTASIIALHADTGRLAWYYQTTPHDHWDFDAAQKLILADLNLGGATGRSSCRPTRTASSTCSTARPAELLSAKNFTYVNWASGVDMKTGRPILTPQIGLVRLAEERLSVMGGRPHLEPDVFQRRKRTSSTSR